MRVLVTGAAGFIGSAIVERLLHTGHEVVACVRDASRLPDGDRLSRRSVDLTGMRAAEDWLGLLDGVDAVVNAAGILRERGRGDFETVHYRTPLALAEACVRHGIDRFVQVSALGDPADGEFVASKHRLDDALMAMDGLEAVIFRPSVVVSLRGSYGGTSMLRAMAALPLVMFLPGNGQQQIQPVLLEDLAEQVLDGVQRKRDQAERIDVVGPEVITLEEFLLATRRWLQLPGPRMVVRVPISLVRLAGRIGDVLRAGPVGSTMTRMLERGNVGNDPIPETGDPDPIRPHSVTRCLQQSASFVQDRWHARLYFAAPLAWLTLVVIWCLSGLSGLTAEPADFQPLLEGLGVPGSWQRPLVLATSWLNLVLALGLLLRLWLMPVLALMWVSVLAYTLGLGLLAPGLWLEPTGGLVKNLGLMLLIPMVMVLENRR